MLYKICFYAPISHAEEVKNAMFAKGAGKLAHYGSCAWQVLGEGQFIPLSGSDAFLGEENKLEKVSEYKIEMICEEQYIHEVIAALKQAHPYDQPAYQVIRMENM